MLKGAKILVADDELHFRKAAARLLEREGCEVQLAADANEALAQLSAHVFDLLIADVHMPGNDGLTVLREQQTVPVLVVTGDPSLQTAVEALRGSAVDYLTKPLSPERFLARVAEGVARARALRRLDDAERRLEAQLELVAGLRASLFVAGGERDDEEPDAASAGASSASEDELPAVVADKLSPREREVLLAFRRMPRPAEVASSLHISPHTVKNHLKAIYRKLEVGSQAELLAHLSEAERAHSS
ncbi:response regulator [Pseudenhygromyxa sp. WMMC2535]|uniref:response regulator transcription factor n=1 Tax=Pseudenhygromyxa sp. WMMC2535 TaxID=2712867 RepID=UPI0015519560|nr:response regulator [Pseudenhygromyxa sp. WMMC2535]NVB36687.1 response regulator [Pseudenhygromyxa sp. WMMC2535]